MSQTPSQSPPLSCQSKAKTSVWPETPSRNVHTQRPGRYQGEGDPLLITGNVQFYFLQIPKQKRFKHSHFKLATASLPIKRRCVRPAVPFLERHITRILSARLTQHNAVPPWIFTDPLLLWLRSVPS